MNLTRIAVALLFLALFASTNFGQIPATLPDNDPLSPITITSPGGKALRIIKCYPHGLMKAYCVSFDDGKLASDKVILDSLRKHKVAATFFINSTHPQSADAMAKPDEYAGFEIASHGANHKGLGKMPLDQARAEIETDQKLLGQAFKFKIEGFAYPYGNKPADPTALEAEMKALGIIYARGTGSSRRFRPPVNFLNWTPDGGLDLNMLKHLDQYQKLEAGDSVCNLMEFAHSIDFVNEKIPLADWDIYLQRISEDKSIWKVTLLDYTHYVNALRDLTITDKGAENKSALAVWIKVDGKETEIPAGTTHKW